MTFETIGSGERLVFIHGLGGTPNVFWPQVKSLSERYRCDLVTLPGSAEEPLCAASLDGIASLIAADVIGEEPAHLVGHSLGTTVCQKIALLRPGKIRSLFLVGPIHAPPEAAREALRARAATVRQSGMVAIVDAILGGALAKRTKEDQPVTGAFVRELILRQPPEGYAALCEALADVEGAAVESFGGQATLVTGREDGVASPAAAEALASRFAAGRIHILEDCGHWATLEQPNAILQLLGAHLAIAARG